MIDLVYNDNKVIANIPQAWDQLTANQFLKIARLLESGMAPDVAHMEALFILTNLSGIGFMLIPDYVKYNALPYALWVFEKQSFHLEKNILPFYRDKFWKEKFVGPEDNLGDVTMVEFNYCEDALFRYKQSNYEDMDALNELVAILYRPCRKMPFLGFCEKVPFHPSALPIIKKQVAQWPNHVKKAILTIYSGFRKNFETMYPLIYSKSEHGGEASKNYFEGLFSLIHQMAGDKYGSFDKVEQTPVHTIMMGLTAFIKESKKNEQV